MKALLITIIITTNGAVEPGIKHPGFEPKVLTLSECWSKLKQDEFAFLSLGPKIVNTYKSCLILKGEDL